MKRLLLLALLCPAIGFAQQRQYIDVGSPNFRPLPIAIAPFQARPEAQIDSNEIFQVLRDDLTLSGLFDIIDPRSFLADPQEGLAPSQIRFAAWSDVGAEGLIKALVTRTTDGFHAEMHLYEVRSGKEVLGRAYDDGPQRGRSVAHRFADEVVQYYTREPSVFRTKIAAIRRNRTGRDLVIFDADGKNPQVVLQESGLALLPAWRPDGRELLFTDYRGGRPDLWAFGLSGRTLRKVVGIGDMSTGGVYSPDGKRMAFTASENGNSDIFVANADGSNAKRLTRDPATDTSPSWSPDGKRIAFVSNRAGNPHIYVMNADGSEQRRITFQGNYNTTPRWSPRGDLIAFTARDERKVFDIFTVSPDTTNISRVTQNQGLTNEEPSWAPNGRLLVFVSDRTGRPQLVISTVNGDRQRIVTSDPGELSTPAWGPLP
jgi:TolB protein